MDTCLKMLLAEEVCDRACHIHSLFGLLPARSWLLCCWSTRSTCSVSARCGIAPICSIPARPMTTSHITIIHARSLACMPLIPSLVRYRYSVQRFEWPLWHAANPAVTCNAITHLRGPLLSLKRSSARMSFKPTSISRRSLRTAHAATHQDVKQSSTFSKIIAAVLRPALDGPGGAETCSV